MKNIKTYKNFVAGLITGILIVTASVSATSPGGTLGGLFKKVIISQNGLAAKDQYVLMGTKIEDETITEYEIGTDAIRADEIQEGAVGTSEIADNSIKTSDIDLSNFELNASKITAGTFKTGTFIFPGVLKINGVLEALSNLKVTGDIYEGGTKLSSKYLGINATSVNSAKLDGKDRAYYTNASNLNSGILNNSRLNSNVTILGQKINTNEQDSTFVAYNSSKLEGYNKAYYLDASNLNAGKLNNARLNSNVTILGQSIEESELNSSVQNKLNYTEGKINLGTKWTIVLSGNDLLFKYNGLEKIRFKSDGKIEATEYILK